MANYQNQRGTYDAFDEEAQCLKDIQNSLSEIVSLYGYHPVVTPHYEQTELFARSAGESSDIVTKEMFDFEDKGGRRITLRPELTAGVIRAVVNNKLYATKDLPLKYYYCGEAYRYERPSAGRYREFRQFGVECVGVNSFYNDAECITLGYNALTAIGFPSLILKINTLGDEASREAYKAALREYFKDKIEFMCADCKRRYQQNVLRILDCKDPDDRPYIEGAPKMSDYLNDASREYFQNVLDILDEQQIPYEIDDTLVRGLDYYSHVVFEFHFLKSDGTSLGAVGAGGHYDNLVKEIGGPQMASVGFAFGLERILALLKDMSEGKMAPLSLDCYIIHLGEATLSHSFSLMEYLRKNLISCDMTYENKSIGAQFKIATRKNASFVVIVGEDEMKTYQYQVKNMRTQEQITVSYDDLESYLFEKIMEEVENGNEE